MNDPKAKAAEINNKLVPLKEVLEQLDKEQQPDPEAVHDALDGVESIKALLWGYV